jgi:hypothetical protein
MLGEDYKVSSNNKAKLATHFNKMNKKHEILEEILRKQERKVAAKEKKTSKRKQNSNSLLKPIVGDAHMVAAANLLQKESNMLGASKSRAKFNKFLENETNSNNSNNNGSIDSEYSNNFESEN